MKASDDELREALRRSHGRQGDRSACPSTESLVRAAEEPGAAAPDLLRHLAECPDCALEYRMAASLKPWAEGAAAAMTEAAPARHVGPSKTLLAYALAASLVASLGLGAATVVLNARRRSAEVRWADARQDIERARDEAARRGREAASMRERAEALSRPQGHVPLVDLFPSDPARGAAASPAALTLSDDAGFAVLILNVRQRPRSASYAVELRDRRDGLVWVSELADAGQEALTLGIPSALLTGKEYRIRLYAASGDRRTLLEEYALRVRRSSHP
jgi:hypothetical protein